MPELPEVEILVRHLQGVLPGRRIRGVIVHRPRVIRPTSVSTLCRVLRDVRFVQVTRRAKYLVFELESGHVGSASPLRLLGHLGMSGRMHLLSPGSPRPKHTAVEIVLDRGRFIFEDPRYFGRLTLDLRPLGVLGPEPLGSGFTLEAFQRLLGRSHQAIKVRLLNQAIAAGVGNIYASEALYRARIHPSVPTRRLGLGRLAALRRSIRAVLRQAIAWGSTVPLDWSRTASSDAVFYYGRDPTAPDHYQERLRVYDRAGEPCRHCRAPIRKMVQAGRGTYFCPVCQRV
jgi:formamidopyrimidine-DNA glycosylase